MYYHYSSRPNLPWATPVVSGHMPCAATLSMSRHISTLNYLGSADTCLTWTVIYWLFVSAITDSANKCSVFGGHFNPKSLAACTLSCDRQFAQISMLPSGDKAQGYKVKVQSENISASHFSSQSVMMTG